MKNNATWLNWKRTILPDDNEQHMNKQHMFSVIRGGFIMPKNKFQEVIWLNHKFCGISDSSRSSVGSYRIASERNIRHQDIRIPVCEES